MSNSIHKQICNQLFEYKDIGCVMDYPTDFFKCTFKQRVGRFSVGDKAAWITYSPSFGKLMIKETPNSSWIYVDLKISSIDSSTEVESLHPEST